MLTDLLGVLFDGLAYGMLLFVLSVGLSVTMGLAGFVNLAHSAFAMLGGYLCVTLMSRWQMPFLDATFVKPPARPSRRYESARHSPPH